MVASVSSSGPRSTAAGSVRVRGRGSPRRGGRRDPGQRSASSSHAGIDRPPSMSSVYLFIYTGWRRINRTVYFCCPGSVFLQQNT